MSDRPPKSFIIIVYATAIAFGVCVFEFFDFLNLHRTIYRVLCATHLAPGLILAILAYQLDEKQSYLRQKLVRWLVCIWAGTTFGIASGWLINLF